MSGFRREGRNLDANVVGPFGDTKIYIVVTAPICP